MYILPKYTEEINDTIAIVSETEIESENKDMQSIFLKKTHNRENGLTCIKIEIMFGIPDVYIKSDSKLLHKEAFVIKFGACTKIYANSKLAANYAISFINENVDNLNFSLVYDYPSFDMRAYKCFIPPRETLKETLKNLCDLLIELRYNILILEVGGAMEYKKRPEINMSWETLCSDVKQYSGKGDDIALGKLYPWPKNVIHVDNGGGSFVSQKELKECIEYCKKRGIDVIPEVPSLSHCDYIVKTYPEIRERKEDMDYPDSYCPGNPKTYEILFDILDEVYEIFEPEYVNIGHDELFSIALCDRCRDEDPCKIFVADVIKIKNYLSEKNVKIMMWADMLSNARPGHGGAGRSVCGDQQYVPALYKIRDMLPKDILMIDWWYNMDECHINVLEEKGFSVLFGNLEMYKFKKWFRLKKECVKGGVTSNWGSLNREYMQRNGQYMRLMFNSFVLWGGYLAEDKKDEVLNKVMEYAYNFYSKEKYDNVIEFVAATDFYMERKTFWDGNFINPDEYIMGQIRVLLKDGRIYDYPVNYGINIVCEKCDDYDNILTLCTSAMPINQQGRVSFRFCFPSNYSKDEIIDTEFIRSKQDNFKFSYKIV